MLTHEGFKRKRYLDFFEDMSEEAKRLFGEDVNLSERSALGKFVSLIAYARAEDNELAEQIYNSRFVDTSEGIPLENNVKRALITRNEWLKATGIVQVELERGATITKGDLVGTNYGVNFTIEQSLKAPEDGVFNLPVKAVEYGVIGNVAANEITKIINPAVGFLSVNNALPFRNGQDEERDAELQDRYYSSLGNAGNRRVESIRARVLEEAEGVRAVLIDENDTMEVSDSGVPPKAFETIVLGGEPEEIARKIFEAKAGGIQAYGSTVIEVEDSRERKHTIGFTYAEAVQIYVKVAVKKGNNYPQNGDSQIKEQVLKYIGGTGSNSVYDGLGMNQDVIVARLEAQLFRVESVEDVRVSLSLDGEIYEETNISISFTEVAETDTSKIEVMNLGD